LIFDICPLSYQILPNIILILAILGIVLIILRRLPEAADLESKDQATQSAHEKLITKGLPAMAISKIRMFLKFWGKKIWNFALEAKDLKPTAVAGYRIKKIFGDRFGKNEPKMSAPASTQEVKNEQYLLSIIKHDPKNPANYDALGKYYLDKGGVEDALDIYRYLAQYEAQSADYHARLAYCQYRLKNFSAAAESYRNSLALDSAQPNRYYNLGLALEAQGKNQEAADAINQALGLEPNNLKYYLGLSLAYEKLGDKSKAAVVLEQARQIDPQSEAVSQRLEKIKMP
jgi:cytochrome c-type biogenesis protein CcmH/NrfG